MPHRRHPLICLAPCAFRPSLLPPPARGLHQPKAEILRQPRNLETFNLAARSPLDGVPRRLGKWMLDEGQWASITNYLGLCVFALLVAFLFVTADHAEVRVSQAVRLLFLAGKCHCAERLTLLGGKQAKKD